MKCERPGRTAFPALLSSTFLAVGSLESRTSLIGAHETPTWHQLRPQAKVVGLRTSGPRTDSKLELASASFATRDVRILEDLRGHRTKVSPDAVVLTKAGKPVLSGVGCKMMQVCVARSPEAEKTVEGEEGACLQHSKPDRNQSRHYQSRQTCLYVCLLWFACLGLAMGL